MSSSVKISALVISVVVVNPASRLGGVARSRCIRSATLLALTSATRYRRHVVHAVASGELVKHVRHPTAIIVQCGHQIAHQHRGADTVFALLRTAVESTQYPIASS